MVRRTLGSNVSGVAYICRYDVLNLCVQSRRSGHPPLEEQRSLRQPTKEGYGSPPSITLAYYLTCLNWVTCVDIFSISLV